MAVHLPFDWQKGHWQVTEPAKTIENKGLVFSLGMAVGAAWAIICWLLL